MCASVRHLSHNDVLLNLCKGHANLLTCWIADFCTHPNVMKLRINPNTDLHILFQFKIHSPNIPWLVQTLNRVIGHTFVYTTIYVHKHTIFWWFVARFCKKRSDLFETWRTVYPMVCLKSLRIYMSKSQIAVANANQQIFANLSPDKTIKINQFQQKLFR